MKPILAFLIFVLLAATLPAEQPNIVFILADDMGYGDLGCYGHPEAKTPVIDQLARDGVRFTQHYANGPECSPTRTAFLTGRYQQRAGVGGVIFAGFNQNRNHGLHQGETTFAELGRRIRATQTRLSNLDIDALNAAADVDFELVSASETSRVGSTAGAPTGDAPTRDAPKRETWLATPIDKQTKQERRTALVAFPEQTLEARSAGTGCPKPQNHPKNRHASAGFRYTEGASS